jgi:hypothetical protein
MPRTFVAIPARDNLLQEFKILLKTFNHFFERHAMRQFPAGNLLADPDLPVFK